VDYISSACGGDVRKAINACETLINAGGEKITLEDAAAVSQKSAMRYDRDGDSHYDVLSAFQKSIRGSDPDAAVHYLRGFWKLEIWPPPAGEFWSRLQRHRTCLSSGCGHR
jgi:replication-associated recombination protein RarA